MIFYPIQPWNGDKYWNFTDYTGSVSSTLYSTELIFSISCTPSHNFYKSKSTSKHGFKLGCSVSSYNDNEGFSVSDSKTQHTYNSKARSLIVFSKIPSHI